MVLQYACEDTLADSYGGPCDGIPITNSNSERGDVLYNSLVPEGGQNNVSRRRRDCETTETIPVSSDYNVQVDPRFGRHETLEYYLKEHSTKNIRGKQGVDTNALRREITILIGVPLLGRTLQSSPTNPIPALSSLRSLKTPNPSLNACALVVPCRISWCLSTPLDAQPSVARGLVSRPTTFQRHFVAKFASPLSRTIQGALWAQERQP